MRQPIGERAARRLPLVAAATVAVVLALLAVRVLTRLIGIPVETSPGIWDAATLGQGIVVCGRDYKRGPDLVISTRAEIMGSDGIDPLAVAPGRCTPGACTREAAGPCFTVVYVRVASDGYVGFSLRGGP
jgi:hypothetical protein